jgi:hypothetical protein
MDGSGGGGGDGGGGGAGGPEQKAHVFWQLRFTALLPHLFALFLPWHHAASLPSAHDARTGAGGEAPGVVIGPQLLQLSLHRAFQTALVHFPFFALVGHAASVSTQVLVLGVVSGAGGGGGGLHVPHVNPHFLLTLVLLHLLALFLFAHQLAV